MIVKSFWEQGYVELVETKSDRRNKQVKLRKEGKKYAKGIVEPFAADWPKSIGAVDIRAE